MTNRPTLTPRTVTAREQQRQKIKDIQKSEMDARRVVRDQDAFNSSVAASNDRYMKSALEKVRESDVTHSETLTKISGTWFYNQTLKN